MTLSDLECHFCCFFLTLIYQWIWHILTMLCVYMNRKVSVVFNRNCIPKMKDCSRLRPHKGSHVHRKCGSIKEKVCRIHTLVLRTSNRKYHIVPSPMTSGDLEGHWPVAGLIKCNTTNICTTFCTVQLTRRIARSLGDSWASCTVRDRNGGPSECGAVTDFYDIWQQVRFADCYRPT